MASISLLLGIARRSSLQRKVASRLSFILTMPVTTTIATGSCSILRRRRQSLDCFGKNGFRKLFTTSISRDRTARDFLSRSIPADGCRKQFPETIHQQGSNGSRFFVPPFYDPANPHIAALLLRQVGLIGHKMAADVTAAGFKGILTNALYDTWWHGGFRTAPYFHNSIGILTEASSARIMTPSNVTREQLARSSTRGMASAMEATTNFPNPWPGGAWHPRDIMQMELIACHAALSLASNYRADYLRNFYELGRANLSSTSSAEPVAYLIPAGQGRDENVAKMIGTLVEQGVEVYRLDHELHGITGAQNITTVTNDRGAKVKQIVVALSSSQANGEIPAGSYIIFLNQPYRQHVLALVEPQSH